MAADGQRGPIPVRGSFDRPARASFRLLQAPSSGDGHSTGRTTEPLDLVRLRPLMDRTSGRPNVTIGLIDGPVLMDHPELDVERVREIPRAGSGACTRADSMACLHGTFVAGILSARRGSAAPAICPGCTLLVRPIFAETNAANGEMPSTTPEELARALLDCIEAGAGLLNVSASLVQPSIRRERLLEAALDEAARRGVIVIAAAGNEGTLGGTAITRHPWVLPVAAYDLRGRPTGLSNLGNSIGVRGVGAPGDGITSLGAEGVPLTLGGTSAAAPFVTGAAALLKSEFPNASAADLRLAIARPSSGRRSTVVPPLLDAWMSYRSLLTTDARSRAF